MLFEFYDGNIWDNIAQLVPAAEGYARLWIQGFNDLAIAGIWFFATISRWSSISDSITGVSIFLRFNCIFKHSSKLKAQTPDGSKDFNSSKIWSIVTISVLKYAAISSGVSVRYPRLSRQTEMDDLSLQLRKVFCDQL